MKFKLVKNGQVLASNIKSIEEARKIQEQLARIYGQGNLITIQIENTVSDYIEEFND